MIEARYSGASQRGLQDIPRVACVYVRLHLVTARSVRIDVRLQYHFLTKRKWYLGDKRIQNSVSRCKTRVQSLRRVSEVCVPCTCCE